MPCRSQAQLLETEAALAKLREQQRHAEDRSSYGQVQLGMMSDLLRVLQVKQELAASSAADSPSKASGHDMLLATGRWGPASGGAVPASGFNTNVMVL